MTGFARSSSRRPALLRRLRSSRSATWIQTFVNRSCACAAQRSCCTGTWFAASSTTSTHTGCGRSPSRTTPERDSAGRPAGRVPEPPLDAAVALLAYCRRNESRPDRERRSARRTVSEDQDWRLQAQLEVGDTRGAATHLIGRLRGPNVVHDVEGAVPHDVVITHDGKLLFAYAASEATLTAARGAIEAVLEGDGVKASIRVSRWDDDLAAWRQTDPPPTAEQERLEAAAEIDADAIETRTLVASSGKLIRAEFEQTMLAWAEKLGVECRSEEHTS